jgi:D-arabinitol 4-dehydrogenase
MDPNVGHAICAAADPLLAFVCERELWGDLTGSDLLYRAFRIAREQVRGLLVSEG